MIRVLLWIIVALTPIVVAGADQETQATRGSVSWNWAEEEWSLEESFHDIQGYEPRPDERVLNAVSVLWHTPEWDALGNKCTFRGQLRQPGDEQGATKPVDWFQGLTLYVGKQPGAKPDWSLGMKERNTIRGTDLIKPTGEFAIQVDMRETTHDRMAAESFQVGVALATHKGTKASDQQVFWTSRTPAIPGSIHLHEIPAAPKLSVELDAINGAAGWGASGSTSGLRLIRAVNVLHPLGKDAALAALQNYLDLSDAGHYYPENEIVFWIIRVLFEPIRLDDRIPAPAIAVWGPDSKNWPLSPIAVVNDVPFMIGYPIGMAGVPEHPSSHIQWARRHGVLRDRPLEPTVNPILSAQAILESEAFLEYDKALWGTVSAAIRERALQMVPQQRLLRRRNAVSDRRWNAAVAYAKSHPLRWDPKRCEFVETDK